jgi:hypothetical protein
LSIYTGRPKKRFSAAVAFYVTIDLLSSRIDYLVAGDYKVTERPNAPKAEILKKYTVNDRRRVF